MRIRRAVVLAVAALLVGPVAPANAEPPPAANVDRIAGLLAPARVVRTHDGIAHVEAANRHDLFFLQGWVHAQDRLFQMDVLRRTPSGTLAEMLGRPALAGDVQTRTIGLRRAAERSWQTATPRVREALLAYADGVNAFARTHPLPPEYAALELSRFEPWTPVDSVVIGKLVAFQLSFDLDIDNTLQLEAYLRAGAAKGFDGAALFFHDLTPFAPFSSASTVPDASQPAGSPSARHDRPARPSAVDAAAEGSVDLARLREAGRLAARYRAAISGVPVLREVLDRDHTTGSNEWAVSGSHTVDGNPIVANDPHLGLSSPSIFYPVHLSGGGFDVAGEGFAGTPGVVLGQNRWIAWGATTNPMDVTDTYLEAVRPDPTSPSGLSTVFQGRLEHVVAVPETFRVNTPGDGVADDVAAVPPGGGVPAATLVVPRRNNGPIVQLDLSSGTALSVQYTGFSATQELDTFLQWDIARTLEDFRRGLEHFDFGSQNWAFADRRGDIAYFTSGEMPLREDLQAGRVGGLPPYFVRDGQGGNEWLPVRHRQPGQAVPYEILPPEEMPHLVNPPAGWFVNANNDPAGTTLDNDPLNQTRPGGGIYYLNPGYDGIRAGRITEMLRAAVADGGRVSADDVAAMQADTTLLDAEFFVSRITAAWRRAGTSTVPELRALADDPAVAEAVGRLSRWDFTTPTGLAEGHDAADRDGRLSEPSPSERDDSVAATLYALWRSRFVASTVDAALAPSGLPLPGGQQALGALRRVLEGQPWVSGLDPFPVAGVAGADDRGAVAMLRAVRAALDRLSGPDFAAAFHGSTDQDDYRWGLLHRLVLAHPLGGPFSVPPAFGRFPAPVDGLAGIPVDGGFGTVDAASHDVRADSVDAFMFGSGPARRYVGDVGPGGPRGRSALPGGTSALPGGAHYLDLLPSYLTDDSYPVRMLPADVRAATESVLTLLPERHRS
jgi:penicillin G amidase